MELSKNNNDRNLDGINITDLWGNMKNMCQNLCRIILEIP